MFGSRCLYLQGVFVPAALRASHCTMASKAVISYSDLKAILGKSESLVLIDVRTKEEVDNGCIPGSLHIPVATVETELALDPADFKAKYGVTKPMMDAPELVFHCQMGKRGAAATEKARTLGYVNACNYAGGWKEWSEKEGQ
ncbi:thiosulfate:glutathione sulfurtransferase [Genypterus blacodes]|uniref:thiosulfate:glutathione sulfurtransferase n=1 Tax=Genypterus blacodes TaxID=154954 RepID=UPI003F75901D